MRTSLVFKGIGLTVGLAAALASTPAHAGDYANVTATPPMYLTINNTKYVCFSAMAPATAMYDWCLPATDPAAAATATVVANAYDRNKMISVGCYTCGTIAGDSKWPGLKWLPDYVFVQSSTRIYGN